MYKNLKLPSFLSFKMKTIHDVFIFDGIYYMNLMPYVLYRINGVEYYDTERRLGGYARSVYVGEVNHVKVEMFNPKKNEYTEILFNENYVNYVGEIAKWEVDSYKEKFKGFLSIDLDNINNFIKFDTVGWIKQNISQEIEVDLYKGVVWSKGVPNKVHRINTLYENRNQLDDYDQNAMFKDFAYVDEYIRYLTAQIKEVSFESNYLELYNAVKDGTISYEDFLKGI